MRRERDDVVFAYDESYRVNPVLPIFFRDESRPRKVPTSMPTADARALTGTVAEL